MTDANTTLDRSDDLALRENNVALRSVGFAVRNTTQCCRSCIVDLGTGGQIWVKLKMCKRTVNEVMKRLLCVTTMRAIAAVSRSVGAGRSLNVSP